MTHDDQDAIGRLTEKVDTILVRMTALSTNCEARRERGDDMAKALWGNGNLGLTMRVDRLEQDKGHEAKAATEWWVKAGVIVAALSAVASLVAVLIK